MYLTLRSNLSLRGLATSAAGSQLPSLPACDFEAPPYRGPSYEKIVEIQKSRLTPNVTPYYRKPLLIHSGKMQWLFDHEGRKYLDMFGGIVTVSVGHCHPKVNAALGEQMETLWHTTNIYMHPKIHEYAERITQTMPGNLNKVYFVNSGSEANDLAMLLARLHTGNHEIISFRNAYHGASPLTMGITAHSTWRFPLPGVSNGIIHAMNPDPFQGHWGGRYCRDSVAQTIRECGCSAEGACEAGEKYYHELEQIFRFSLPRGRVAGMFAESIQGVGGTVQYPKGYIAKAAKLVRANGGVFIADEVQSGFGRTGDHFWGFQGHGIVPDIVTCAKGIGNGFPIGAVITTPEIAQCLDRALHFNTYGGNALASAVGIAVLDVIEEEELQKNSQIVGTELLKGLLELQKKYEVIGDVRGKGLMIGVELVEDRTTRKPLSIPHVIEIWEKCKDLGILLGRGGLNGNALRIKPPMCVTLDDAQITLEAFEDVLLAHFKKKRRNALR